MSAPITFEVIGVPKAQGSHRAIAAKGGVAFLKPSGGADFAAWRNAVAQAAKDIAAHDDIAAPLDGPLYLHVTFRFPMPKNVRKTDRERGWRWKTTAPDVDKLTRTIGDACTAAALIVDDARFVEVVAEKHEVTGWTGATVAIGRV